MVAKLGWNVGKCKECGHGSTVNHFVTTCIYDEVCHFSPPDVCTCCEYCREDCLENGMEYNA